MKNVVFFKFSDFDTRVCFENVAYFVKVIPTFQCIFPTSFVILVISFRDSEILKTKLLLFLFLNNEVSSF